MPVMVDLAVVWLVGVLAAIPAIIWFARDLGKVRSQNWYWTGHRPEPWQWGVLLGWLAGGWPALVVILVWAHSAVRRDLRIDAENSQFRRRSTDR